MSPNGRNRPVQAKHGATPQPHDGRETVAPAKPRKLLRLTQQSEI